MAKLEELNPRLTTSAALDGVQELTFLCPSCRQRMVSVNIWAGKAGPVKYSDGQHVKLWHAEQGQDRDWASLSITPSIDAQHRKPAANGCTGWHGFVTKGEAA